MAELLDVLKIVLMENAQSKISLNKYFKSFGSSVNSFDKEAINLLKRIDLLGRYQNIINSCFNNLNQNEYNRIVRISRDTSLDPYDLFSHFQAEKVYRRWDRWLQGENPPKSSFVRLSLSFLLTVIEADELATYGSDRLKGLIELYTICFEALGITFNKNLLKRLSCLNYRKEWEDWIHACHLTSQDNPRVSPYDVLCLTIYLSMLNLGSHTASSSVTPSVASTWERFLHSCSQRFNVDDSLFINFDQNKRISTRQLSLGKATDNTDLSSRLSIKFLNSGAKDLINKSFDDTLSALRQLSKVFNSISETSFMGPVKTTHSVSRDSTIPSEGDVLVDLYNHLVLSCTNAEKRKEILKIKGPLGSYKNRIMQYLYLMVQKDENEITPIYINLSYYEKKAENEDSYTSQSIIDEFLDDIKSSEDVLNNENSILFLDGIRDFKYGRDDLYYSIKKKISELKCKLAICVDGDFTVNSRHIFKVHPLVSNSYDCYLRIRSINLNRRKECLSFIESCIKVFNVNLPSKITPETIYSRLVRLNFISIDAYWFVKLLKNSRREFFDSTINIADIYKEICISYLGNSDSVGSAAELAFEFEYGSLKEDESGFFNDMRWALIQKQRNILDYLIAVQYIKKVSLLDFNEADQNKLKKDLDFFNMVLQKNITRFIIAMLKGDEDYEDKIMILAREYYDKLNLLGKSELTFWMARLQNKNRREECKGLLKSYHQTEIARYNSKNFSSYSEKKDIVFLLRGINVSLIYENDFSALEYYIDSLLHDKLANIVNRGFHLEYYGDKTYIPKKTPLDYEEDLSVGNNTMSVICLSLDGRMKRKDVTSFVAVLEVMTLCNLIQARIEEPLSDNVLDISPYINKCIDYLRWIVPQETVKKLKEAETYFKWMIKELERLKKNNNGEFTYSRSFPYNKFSKAHMVQRTGWVKMGLHNPENIVEHMYNCWLLGMLFLPNDNDIEGYSKDSILKMLLIHDLGETETGDINRPEKALNSTLYDKNEDEAMQILLQSGTYPNAVDLYDYSKEWNDWKEKTSINYLIARDIDNLQTVYQFCSYYTENPGYFSSEDIKYWISGVEKLYTGIVRDIADLIIYNNPDFSHLWEDM